MLRRAPVSLGIQLPSEGLNRERGKIAGRAGSSRGRCSLPASGETFSTALVERNRVDDQAVGVELGNQNAVSFDVDANVGNGCI